MKALNPILALAPMDGYTDAAFRYIVDRCSRPDLFITEFTSAEGLSRAATKLLVSLIKHNDKACTWGQLFGSDPQAFYQGALIVAAMGLDGVDLNMGCPNRTIARHGAGADLIRQPKLAQKLIISCQRAVRDWWEGITLEQAKVHSNIIDWIKNYRFNKLNGERQILTVSVKTRIGYEQNNVYDWISTLLDVRPYAISLHGRTFRQMYRGKADWDAIGQAVILAQGSGTLILGNGDVRSRQEAFVKAETYGVNGVLIGRAALGNPFIFGAHQPSQRELFNALFDQMEFFIRYLPQLRFVGLRKHFGFYCRYFSGASELRQQLLRTQNSHQVKEILKSILHNCANEGLHQID